MAEVSAYYEELCDLMTHGYERGLVSQVRSLLSHPTTAPGSSTADAAVLPPELADLIWLDAARVRGEIEESVNAGLKNDMVGMMRFVSDWQQEMAKASHSPRLYSWWVTGLGVLDGASWKSGPSRSSESALSPPVSKVCRMQRAQSALSSETTAATINISPMIVSGERLCVGGSWQDCLFDVSLGERVMADLEVWLGQLA